MEGGRNSYPLGIGAINIFYNPNWIGERERVEGIAYLPIDGCSGVDVLEEFFLVLSVKSPVYRKRHIRSIFFLLYWIKFFLGTLFFFLKEVLTSPQGLQHILSSNNRAICEKKETSIDNQIDMG